MNCRRAVSRLSAYLDGELTGQEMMLVRRHLSSCEACSTELAGIREVKMSLSELTPATPDDEFLGHIFQGLDNVTASPKGIRLFWDMHRVSLTNSFNKAGLAAAVCSLLFIAVYFTNGGMENGKIQYPGNQNMVMADFVSGKFAGMSTNSDVPYSIGNDKPLPVITSETPYSYCRSQCAKRSNKSNAPLASEKNPYIDPRIVVTANALYQ